MAYATTDQVAAGFRTLSAEESAVAATLLERAERLLISRFPTLVTRVEAGTVNRDLVADIEAAMVVRVLRNPDAKKQESIDDYSWTRDTAVSSGALYVSAEEAKQLLPAALRARSVTLRTHSSPPL